MIVVDTSVWIDFFDYPTTRYAQTLKKLIEVDADLAIVDISLTEILRGIKDDHVFDKVRGALKHFPVLTGHSQDIFIDAAQVCRQCSKKGKVISKTIDAYIAAVTISHHAQLFHKDKDFDTIAQYTPLKIYSLLSDK